MTCIAPGPATSVVPILHFCVSDVPSLSLCLDECLSHIFLLLLLFFFSLQGLTFQVKFLSFCGARGLPVTWMETCTAHSAHLRIPKMTPIGHNKQTRHSMSTSLRMESLGCPVEGPSVRDEAPGHPWQRRARQVSHGVTCAPPNNSSSHYLLRTVGEEKPVQMWPCADQAFSPGYPPPPSLPSGCILRTMTSHSDSAAFNRSHVTFVTLHASQVCISAVSSPLTSKTPISHSRFSGTCSSMMCMVFTEDKLPLCKCLREPITSAEVLQLTSSFMQNTN